MIHGEAGGRNLCLAVVTDAAVPLLKPPAGFARLACFFPLASDVLVIRAKIHSFSLWPQGPHRV